MLQLSVPERALGVCAASAGNHAQGVAFGCKSLRVKGIIFMADTVPLQKKERVEYLGNSWVQTVSFGKNFDEANARAREHAAEHNLIFIPPFDDEYVIAGQGILGVELLERCPENVDAVVGPIGGGGLMAGVATAVKAMSPHTRTIGVEAKGAESMTISREKGKLTTLDTVDTFVDGAAVRTPGIKTFEIGLEVIDETVVVEPGKVAEEMLNFRNRESVWLEPAGALSIAALDQLEIKGKTIVCILSGGNHDSARDEEVRQRMADYQGLEPHFIVTLPERAGAFLQFASACIPPDEVINVRYKKEHSHETGHLFVGMQFKSKKNRAAFLARLKELDMPCEIIGRDNPLFRYFA